MRRIMLAVLPALLLAHAALAAETPAVCVSPEAAITNVIVGSAGAGFKVSVQEKVSGEALPALVDFINHVPPASDFDADLAVVFEAENLSTGKKDPRSLIVLFKNGCKLAGVMLPAAAVQHVLGDPA